MNAGAGPVVVPAEVADVENLMNWFPDAASVREWAGPFMRYPFDRASFLEDLRRGTVASYVLRPEAGELLAFGQYSARYGRMHLARLAVSPSRRDRGVGRKFASALMRVARTDMGLDEFSLFVYTGNARAIRCYSSLGFVVADYPPGAPLAGEALYMVCAASAAAA